MNIRLLSWNINSVRLRIDTLKKIIKIVDILGREINIESKDILLLYIYEDGSIEKKYMIE